MMPNAVTSAYALEGQQSPSLVTGICHVSAPEPTSMDTTQETITMPDGARLHALCWQRDHDHLPDHSKYSWPAEGDYKFHTELNSDGSFMVIAETEDADPYSGPPSPIYPCQTIYAESWRPDITVNFQKSSAYPELSVGDFYTFKGAVYNIYPLPRGGMDGRSNPPVKTTVTLDEHGRGQCKLPIGRDYFAKEVRPPRGYKRNPQQIRFRTTMEGMTVQLVDEPQDMDITIQKQDLATGGAAQQALSLKDAEFTLTDCTGRTGTAKTDEKGVAKFIGVPIGDFTYYESKAPAGYALSSERISHDIDFDNLKVEDTLKVTATKPVVNRPIAFDVEISKFKRDEGETGGVMRPAKGVVFKIISKTTGKVIASITTDVYGTARTPDGAWYGDGERKQGIKGSIPFDPKGYIVREDKASVPEGYAPMDDFMISPEQQVDGVRLKYIVENTRPSSYLQIVKTDKVSGQRVPLSGFTFELLDENMKPITQECWHPQHIELTRFTTDASGTVTLPQQLADGTYHIREVEAVAPYLKRGEPVKFSMSNGGSVAIVHISDEQAIGEATIIKSCSATGKKLEGAEFDVVAQEDVISPDGRVMAAKDAVVGHVKTDENGKATCKNLALGTGKATYAFIETKPSAGHAGDPTPHPFTLEYKNGDTPKVTAKVEVENAPTRIVVDKKDVATGKPLAGAEFSLSRVSTDGKEEKPVERITDKQGQVAFDHLEEGPYRLRESSAPDGYVRSDEVLELRVDAQGLIDGEPARTVTRTNDFTKVDISKKSVTGEKELPGAKLRLSDSKGKTVEEWVSTDKPHRIERLKPDTYTLEESMTPQGYDRAQSVTFDVEATGTVQAFAMHDEEIRVDAEVDKRQQIANPTHKDAASDTKINGGEPLKQDGSFDYAIDAQSTSSTWVDEFTVTDSLLCAQDGLATLSGITTPICKGDYDGLLNVWYQTTTRGKREKGGGSQMKELPKNGTANATLEDGHINPWLKDPHVLEKLGSDAREAEYGEWKLWEKDVSTEEARELSTSDLMLKEGEQIAGIRFEFGCVEKGFTTNGADWKRKNTDDPHDNYQGTDQTQRLGSAVLHMRVTDDYGPERKLENAAQVIANRNGGSTEQLHADDADRVEQQAKRKPVALFDLSPAQKNKTLDQTGGAGLATVTACGLATGCLAVAYVRRKKGASLGSAWNAMVSTGAGRN